MISDRKRALAEQVIKLHDGKSFDMLQNLSTSSNPEEGEGLVTEDVYMAACDNIKRELGALESIEFIDCLSRSHSQLTLWKAKYSSSEDEVFWAIGFDREEHKVGNILVNW